MKKIFLVLGILIMGLVAASVNAEKVDLTDDSIVAYGTCGDANWYITDDIYMVLVR